jgi:hypothetical protein
MHNTLSHGSKT